MRAGKNFFAIIIYLIDKKKYILYNILAVSGMRIVYSVETITPYIRGKVNLRC